MIIISVEIVTSSQVLMKMTASSLGVQRVRVYLHFGV